MLWVGLSGGIGSGKSTVSARLSELGAVVLDADQIAREVVEPGMPALAEIVQRFGPEVLTEAGELDRPALGRIVFGDPQVRRDLEAITHPRISERTSELLAAAPQDAVVVHDIPLLAELDRASDYALTVIVDVPAEVRLHRLVELRGMDEDEAARRIAAQADDDARRRAADVLLPNVGSVQELHAAVDRLWHERLRPFEVNLRGNRRPETRRSSQDTDALDTDALARTSDRLRAALGEHVVRAEPADETGDLQLVVRELALLDDPQVRRRLSTRGFVVDAADEPPSTRTVWGVDPRRPVRVRVRPADRRSPA